MPFLQKKTTRRRSYAILFFAMTLLLFAPANAANAAAGATATPKDQIKGDETPSTPENNDPEPPQQQCEGDDETCKVRIVTVEELATKTGEDGGKELWLSILGQVYNVSAGPEYYAPGSGYHIFAGRDATVPFITGNFTPGEALKDTDELSAAQLYALDQEWGKFYANEKRYHFLGFLCCRYYDEQGQPTEETLRVAQRVKSYAKIKEAKDRERKENRRKMTMMGGTAAKPTTTPQTQQAM